MSLAKDFRPQAVEDESLPPAKETPEEVERRFWRNVNLRPPLYGADVPGSLFDEDLKVQCPPVESVWNVPSVMFAASHSEGWSGL